MAMNKLNLEAISIIIVFVFGLLLGITIGYELNVSHETVRDEQKIIDFYHSYGEDICDAKQQFIDYYCNGW
jgi:hypothetical protein